MVVLLLEINTTKKRMFIKMLNKHHKRLTTSRCFLITIDVCQGHMIVDDFISCITLTTGGCHYSSTHQKVKNLIILMLGIVNQLLQSLKLPLLIRLLSLLQYTGIFGAVCMFVFYEKNAFENIYIMLYGSFI